MVGKLSKRYPEAVAGDSNEIPNNQPTDTHTDSKFVLLVKSNAYFHFKILLYYNTTPPHSAPLNCYVNFTLSN